MNHETMLKSTFQIYLSIVSCDLLFLKGLKELNKSKISYPLYLYKLLTNR